MPEASNDALFSQAEIGGLAMTKQATCSGGPPLEGTFGSTVYIITEYIYSHVLRTWEHIYVYIQPLVQMCNIWHGLVDFHRLTGKNHPEVDSAIATYVTSSNKLTDAEETALIAEM